MCQFVKTYYSFKIVGRRHARCRIQLELKHADNPLFTKSLKECIFFEVSCEYEKFTFHYYINEVLNLEDFET